MHCQHSDPSAAQRGEQRREPRLLQRNGWTKPIEKQELPAILRLTLEPGIR